MSNRLSEIGRSSSKLFEKISDKEVAAELLDMLNSALKDKKIKENVDFLLDNLPYIQEGLGIFLNPELLKAMKDFLRDKKVRKGLDSILSASRFLFELSDAWPMLAGMMSPLMKEALEDKKIKGSLANIIESLGILAKEGRVAILLKIGRKVE
jgi:hypothetical protein